MYTITYFSFIAKSKINYYAKQIAIIEGQQQIHLNYSFRTAQNNCNSIIPNKKFYVHVSSLLFYLIYVYRLKWVNHDVMCGSAFMTSIKKH